MSFITNYDALATSNERKIILDLLESAIISIKPEKVVEKNISLMDKVLKIQDESISIDDYDHIYIVGFGKGSAKIASILESMIGALLTSGYVIDLTGEEFSKIDFTKGTHPLPSQTNFDFTSLVLNKMKSLSKRDLVLVITCGGGSAMLIQPKKISVDQLIETNKALLESGATISDMNTVRKHLSKVKGGGLGAALFPAKVFNLIFSDVPGNDFSVIASGPTVMDKSTIDDAKSIFSKFNLSSKISVSTGDLDETTKDPKIFENVKNILMLSNKTALSAMEERAKELGKKVKLFSSTFQSDAKIAGKKLIEECEPNSILLTGGETTVKVTGKGQGGRNQEVVLGALAEIDKDTFICSFATDGWDNLEVAGAIGDIDTVLKAEKYGVNPNNYLIDNDSLNFFKTVGDAILTGRLPANVSDLIIVLKK